jgi:hypothetical protein
MTLGEIFKEIQDHLAEHPDHANLSVGYFEDDSYGGTKFSESYGIDIRSFTEYVSPQGYVRKTVVSI